MSIELMLKTCLFFDSVPRIFESDELFIMRIRPENFEL